MRLIQRSPVIFQVQIITDGRFLPPNQATFCTVSKGAHDTAVTLPDKMLYCIVGAIQHLPVILAGRQFLHHSLRVPSDHVRQDKRFIGRKPRADNVAAMKRCRECKPHLLKEKIGHHIFGIRRQAINLHDLTVLIEETGAYPTAVLCRIEWFFADLQLAAARSPCRNFCGSKTILVTAIHAARIGFFRRC